MVAFTIATTISLSMCLNMCCEFNELLARPCTAMADDWVPTLPPIPASNGMKSAISGWLPSVLVKQSSSNEEPIPPNIPMMSHGRRALVCTNTLSLVSTSCARPAVNCWSCSVCSRTSSITSSTVICPTRRFILSTTGIATRLYFSMSMVTSSIGVSTSTLTTFVLITCFTFETEGLVIIFFNGNSPRRRSSSSTT